MHSYNKGQAIICSATFQDGVSGSYIDPTTVTFHDLDPSGNNADHIYGVDPGLVKDSVGHYHYNLLLDEVGNWHYRWDCTGSHAGAAEGVVHCCTPAYSGW